MADAFQKRKKFKEQFRRFVINFFIILLIFAFASTLGIYWGTSNQNAKIFKILKVNNAVYNYSPGSAFYYLLNQERNVYNKQTDMKFSEADIDSYSINDFINSAILSDFGTKIGEVPPKLVLSSYIQQFGVNRAPDPGLIDFIKMQYFRNAFVSSYGDIANALTPISLSEIYNYNDLINYNASAEFLYLNTTNYIVKMLSDTDVIAYYQKNISNYVNVITVDDIAISNNRMAYQISGYINTNGWDNALANYKSNYTYTPGLLLMNTNGTSKRFNRSIGLSEGMVMKAPQFESGVYHIDKIKSLAGLNELGSTVKSKLISDYVSLNYPELRLRFGPEIKSVVSNAGEMTKSDPDFVRISGLTGMSYSKSGKISPISETLKDESGNIIPIPISSGGISGLLDFIFTNSVNSVSKTYNGDDIYVIAKINSRASAGNPLDLKDINISGYYSYKKSSIQRDWFQNLKSKYKITVYDKETNELLKQYEQ